jgi:PilZ domain-containing protein
MAGENRTSKRRLINHGARIAALDGSELQSCHILDISGTGARLKVSLPEDLPDQFLLLLSHDGKLRRICSVVWRRDKAVGVQFIIDRKPGRSG